MRKKGIRLLISSVLCLLLAFSVAGPAFAQGPPPTPHSFYGTVTVDGVLATAPATIEASGAGVMTPVPYNPLTTTVDGEYGSHPVGPWLVVQGYIDEGTPIEFYVNGAPAQLYDVEAQVSSDTYPFHSGTFTELNLTVGEAPTEPDISVSPTSKNFGDVTVGSSSSAQTFTVSNVGTANLVVGTIAITGTNANQFSKQNDNCSGETIAPGNSATLEVVFSPTSPGAKSATLNIPSNDPDEATVTVSLSGNGVAEPVPDISVSPTSKNFGNITVDSSSSPQIFTVSNVGTADLVVATITISGANANQFSKQNDNSSGETIAPGSSATLEVVFSPTSTGAKSATLNIPSNDPDEATVTISLSGTGVAPPTEPTIAFSPASLSFWACEGGADPEDQTLEIWNSGGGTLDWEVSDNALWLSLSPTSGSSIGEHDSVTVSVDITGLSVGSYSATITITDPGATNSPQTVPVSLHIVEFDCGELTNVELMDVDPGVDSITVSSCALDEVDMTDMPEGVDCQNAYVVDSTGTPGSSFTLRFTDIADASSIRIYKIVDTTWIELAVTVIDATTIEITMEVGDPHIVFALPTAPPPPPPPEGVGGTAYPPNKLAILAPWIALGIILAGGITWLVLRRRRAYR